MNRAKQRLARIERSLSPREKITLEDLLMLIHDPNLSDAEKERIRQGPLEPSFANAFKVIEARRKSWKERWNAAP